jgi:diaminopimelate epimerase
MKVEFTKMHGAGNDFVVVDEWEREIVSPKEKPATARSLCDRHHGVGADGVIFVQKSGKSDANFIFYNPDGSRAEMCGNGIRCFAKYLYERGIARKEEITAETLAGDKTLKLSVEGGVVKSVTVSMGAPQIRRGEAQVSFGDASKPMVNEEIEAGGETYRLTAVGMGNPHAILFVDGVKEADVRGDGARIRNAVDIFPKGVNVHFVEKTGTNEFAVRTFERGVEDETLACGTGICASAVAAVLNKKANAGKPIVFHARGGDIEIRLEGKGQDITEVHLTGPAEEVFKGVWQSKNG